MPYNPMKTRKEWQQKKKDFGIPDRVIKGGSFGEKMEKLKKKFDSLGLRDVTDKNARAGLSFADECDALLDEWLTAARQRKATDFKNRAEAIKVVEGYKTEVGVVRHMAEIKLNPLLQTKQGWKSFRKMWQDAVDHPTDAAKLQNMYTQGIRNALGKGLHAAYELRDTLNFPPALSGKIAQYEKYAERWNTLQGSSKILAKDDVRAKFWKDMQKAVALAEEIIQLGT